MRVTKSSSKARAHPSTSTARSPLFRRDPTRDLSVAAKAGIKPNDIVYELAGHPIASAADLRAEVNSVAPGEQANIKLHRNGSKEFYDATAGYDQASGLGVLDVANLADALR
jgi:S1-C subfamily serine protease